VTVANLRSLVRPVVTLMLVVALVIGFFTGRVTPDAFIPIVASILSWWFASREKSKDG
jgi:hypothetical protein